MALSFYISSPCDKPITSLNTLFHPPVHPWKPNALKTNQIKPKIRKNRLLPITCSSVKIVRDPKLDQHVVKQNKIRFVQKLKTLLLSKPKHFLPLSVLSKCRSYLSLSKSHTTLSMIHRYPTIFELFTIPMPQTPMNATKPLSQLCVRLTPAAAALAAQELSLKSSMELSLAAKLQKLLMLSSHQRLLLSKLVHIAPDLGLPPNFRSRLCNDHPEKFKTVETSYGRALELVSWDHDLAKPLPSPGAKPLGLIVDRPPKFKHLRLRKGLNVKRRHHDYLVKFGEIPDICPYKTKIGDFLKESVEAEKRACGIVREVLAMTVEKRTLVDHLTHFRKEFWLPNKLRGMIIRHPELFYVSVKGQRDSVFLVESYDDKGKLLEKDELLVLRDRLMGLVREGKRLRREKRKVFVYGDVYNLGDEVESNTDVVDDYMHDDYDDGLDDLFGSEDSDEDGDDDDGNVDESNLELLGVEEEEKFWVAEAASSIDNEGGDKTTCNSELLGAEEEQKFLVAEAATSTAVYKQGDHGQDYWGFHCSKKSWIRSRRKDVCVSVLILHFVAEETKQ